jgi:hypothetical protein
MILGRPGSHILMMLYFLTMGGAFAFTGYSLLQAGDQMYKGEFLLAAPYVGALISLQSRSRWSYYICAVLSFIFPGFLVGTLLLLLIKVAPATFSTLAPSFLGSSLLFFLFYRFTFGSASRAYYGFGTPSGSVSA